MNLNLNLAAAKQQQEENKSPFQLNLKLDNLHQDSNNARHQEEQRLQGHNVQVRFTLPGGEVLDAINYRMGTVVEKLKLDVEDKADIPYRHMDLYLNNDRLMPDPLTLSDFGIDPAQQLSITVRLRDDIPEDQARPETQDSLQVATPEDDIEDSYEPSTP